MLIDVTDTKPPFDRPPFDCHAAVTVGGIVYDVGGTERAMLREDARVFARGLQAREPFAPEFGYEPLFNVEFNGDHFVTYRYRQRFKSRWWPAQWLGMIRVVSRPESVSEATAYLFQFVATLRSPASITALSDKAGVVRQIASTLGFAYSEEKVFEGDLVLVRFSFELTDNETTKLVSSIPREVYAYQAIFDKPLEGEP